MVNSAKQGYETTCRIEKLNDGNLRLAFSVKLAHLFGKPSGTTYRIRPGLIDTPQNWSLLETKCWVIHSDVLDGCFDPTLKKYGLGKHKQIALLEPPVKDADLLEIWDYYVDYRKNSLSLNTINKLTRHWRNALIETLKNAGKNPLAIRKWLVENKTYKTSLEVLRNLDKSHKLAVKHGLCKNNPFEDMCLELSHEKRRNKLEDNHSVEDIEIDNSVLAYSLNEMETIILHFREILPGTPANIFEFLFLTGCRVSEAIGIKWSDIKWDRECIVFSRQWIDHSQCFAPLKGTKSLPDNKQYRIFPMPKNGRLWKLIEQLPKTSNYLNLIFVDKNNKPLGRTRVWEWWSGHKRVKKYGVVRKLAEAGQISKYLSLHHTRHTFNCIQVNLYGIDSKVVSSWIGHHPEVNERHYWEVDKRIRPGYGEEKILDSSEAELFKEMINNLQKQLKEQQELIVNLQEQLQNKQNNKQ
jgi:integrase